MGVIAVEEPAPYPSACNAQAGLAGRPKQTRLVEIRMTKTTLYLTEQELALSASTCAASVAAGRCGHAQAGGLLARDPALWKLAIGRGKGIKRAGSSQGRNKKLQKEEPNARQDRKTN